MTNLIFIFYFFEQEPSMKKRTRRRSDDRESTTSESTSTASGPPESQEATTNKSKDTCSSDTFHSHSHVDVDDDASAAFLKTRRGVGNVDRVVERLDLSETSEHGCCALMESGDVDEDDGNDVNVNDDDDDDESGLTLLTSLVTNKRVKFAHHHHHHHHHQHRSLQHDNNNIYHHSKDSASSSTSTTTSSSTTYKATSSTFLPSWTPLLETQRLSDTACQYTFRVRGRGKLGTTVSLSLLWDVGFLVGWVVVMGFRLQGVEKVGGGFMEMVMTSVKMMVTNVMMMKGDDDDDDDMDLGDVEVCKMLHYYIQRSQTERTSLTFWCSYHF
jgi:hypothetical protein